jgi:hypothetical protein
VKAPSERGFSYIEIWLLGIQIPIILAIVEYGILLTMKRMQKKDNGQNSSNSQWKSSSNQREGHLGLGSNGKNNGQMEFYQFSIFYNNLHHCLLVCCTDKEERIEIILARTLVLTFLNILYNLNSFQKVGLLQLL